MDDLIVSIVFLVLHVLVALGMWHLFSTLKKKYNFTTLDKALMVVVYIILGLLMYFLTLASMGVNSTSTIHVNKNLFSGEECDMIINAANEDARLRHGWTTRRHKSYPTTDVSIYSMNETLMPFVSWMNSTVESRIYPLLSNKFDVPSGSLYMRDLFVVKYNENGQTQLPEHRDNSKLSFNIALSSHGVDFLGGGTHFSLINRTISIDKGSMLSHDSGLYHTGMRITSGTRYIIVGFVNLRRYHWWRAFGTLASCVSYPQFIAGLASTPTSSTTVMRTICRSRFWITKHQINRSLRNIVNVFFGSDRTGLDVDVGVKAVVIVLIILIISLFLVLALACCQGKISNLTSIDVIIMKFFNVLSNEELAYLKSASDDASTCMCDIVDIESDNSDRKNDHCFSDDTGLCNKSFYRKMSDNNRRKID